MRQSEAVQEWISEAVVVTPQHGRVQVAAFGATRELARARVERELVAHGVRDLHGLVWRTWPQVPERRTTLCLVGQTTNATVKRVGRRRWQMVLRTVDGIEHLGRIDSAELKGFLDAAYTVVARTTVAGAKSWL